MVHKYVDLMHSFHNYTVKAENKTSHLHKFKEIPNPEGNRAERRAAAKKLRKKK